MSDQSLYEPDDEEIKDAANFMNKCSNQDLVESWNRISGEWDLQSVVSLHGFLCGSGRINDLIAEFKSK
jgi:hypothetical protein